MWENIFELLLGSLKLFLLLDGTADRGWPVLHVCHLLGRLGPGVWQGELRPPGPGRLQQPVNAQEADLRAAPRHQEGVVIQGLGRPHAGLHHRGRGLQLGRWRLRQTGPRQQLHTEIPQTDPGTTAGEGTASPDPLTFTSAESKTERVCAVLRLQVVVCVSAGYRHSAAVSEDGELYTWGEGDFGRLGRLLLIGCLTSYLPSDL